MSCINSNCCELAEKAKTEIREYCESLVYSDRKECVAYIVDSFSRLYTVDLATGVPTLIGATGVSGITDIAWDGSTLYGITFSGLYSINTTTGVATFIGNHGASANALESDASGQLYMMNSTNLYTLNKVTAVATVVGPLGAGFSSYGDLAFDASGALFGSFTNGNLGRINPLTGAAANIGPFGFVPVYGLDFCDGILYGVTNGGDLITVDPNTGASVLVANIGITNVWGMSIAEKIIPIPCDEVELPELAPIFTLRYGEYPGDVLEENDVQCLCITACNPYRNVCLENVMVYIAAVYGPNGQPVDPKQFLFKPGHMICFGDLAPCGSADQTQSCGCEHESCSSREFVVVTRDAKLGDYKIVFDYCFDVKWRENKQASLQIEVQ